MINILIPMAGKSLYFPESDFPYPKPLVEIGQKTMIERVIHNLSTIDDDVQFIFVLNKADCRKFHLDSTLNLITRHQCKIVRLDNTTQGAACSALMAIGHIDAQAPLIIANYDQLFETPLPALLAELRQGDAGVVTFESVHPRWSYVRLDEQGKVVETSEKRPISHDAIAGLYYFRQGQDFVEAAMRSIRKDASIDGLFYIAPTLNELILMGKDIRVARVDGGLYHTFYTPQKIKEYESQRLRRALRAG